MASNDLPREPWAVDVALVFVNPWHDGRSVEAPLVSASWTWTRAGWELGGLLDRAAADLQGVETVRVLYPDGVVETLPLTGPPRAHAKVGDPCGTFTTFPIKGEPQWPGARVQREAMLQELRDEGFTIEGDGEAEAVK